MTKPNKNHVKIFDTTLRDGEQAPGFSMTAGQKLRMAKALEGLGVDIMEAGFAAASPGDFDAIKTIATEVKDSIVCSLARCNDGDIRASGEAIKPAAQGRIHTFIATSPLHREYKLMTQLAIQRPKKFRIYSTSLLLRSRMQTRLPSLPIVMMTLAWLLRIP